MTHSISWDEFRLVKAIADTGSLTGAAGLLGQNHSTVFRRLGALEAALAVRLFERARTGYAPTPAGLDMAALAARMEGDIVAFERKVAGRDVKPSGDLRVTTNDTMLVHLLTPMLASFCKAYPDIRLDVIVGNQALNLSRRDADVAIRATETPSETLVGRRIATIAWARYAPVAMVEGGREPDDMDVPWVGFGDSLSRLAAIRWLDGAVGSGRVVYRVNTVLGLAEAIAAGIGIGFLPCFIGDRTPGIARVGEAVAEPWGGLWLLTHPDLRHAARVRAFMDHVGAELARARKLIEGK